MIKSITANEARRYVDEAKKEYYDACTAIHNAAKLGEHEVKIPKVSWGTSNQLDANGFDCSQIDRDGKEITRIWWGN